MICGAGRAHSRAPPSPEMADAEAPLAAGKPSLSRSMSTRGKFAKEFVSGHDVPDFDTGMLGWNCGGLFLCLLVALLFVVFGQSSAALLCVQPCIIGAVTTQGVPTDRNPVSDGCL